MSGVQPSGKLLGRQPAAASEFIQQPLLESIRERMQVLGVAGARK